MGTDPGTTAVVLIEFQNDFASDGGALHGAVQGVMDSTNMLENAKHLVDEARCGRGDHHPRAHPLRGGVPGDHRSSVRDP